MSDELSSDNLRHLKEMEKRFKEQKEELSRKTLFEFNDEPKSIEEKIEELATQYNYVEVLTIAKQHNIRAGPKVRMLSRLLEKGADEIKDERVTVNKTEEKNINVDGLRKNIQDFSHENHPIDEKPEERAES